MRLTCSGRSKLRDSLHQWESLTAVSTALVVVEVLVRTSMVRAVVLCSRSVGLIDPGTADPACYGQPRKVRHELKWSNYNGYNVATANNTVGLLYCKSLGFLNRDIKTVLSLKLLWEFKCLTKKGQWWSGLLNMPNQHGQSGLEMFPCSK